MRNALTPNATTEIIALEAQQAQEEIVLLQLANEARHGWAPFYYDCPLDAVEDVARGLRPEAAVHFLLARHMVVVGGDEWRLDGDLALWRKVRAYATELNHQGLLKAVQGQGELVYQRIERR